MGQNSDVDEAEIGIDSRVIEQWKTELENTQKNEVVRIVSGEFNCNLYNAIADEIQKCHDDRNVTFRIMGGPVISVDEKGKNAILDLAKKRTAEVWIAPTRRLRHFRVYGNRVGYDEDYHEALDKERSFRRVDDAVGLSRMAYDFDNLIDVLAMPKFTGHGGVVLAPKSLILKVKKKYGRNYDFLTGEEFAQIAKKIDTQ